MGFWTTQWIDACDIPDEVIIEEYNNRKLHEKTNKEGA